MTNREQFRRDGGFTLIELIIVIVILGILAAIAAPKFSSMDTDAKKAVMNGAAGALQSAAVVAFATNKVAGSGKPTFASVTAASTIDATIKFSQVAISCGSASGIRVEYGADSATINTVVVISEFCSG